MSAPLREDNPLLTVRDLTVRFDTEDGIVNAVSDLSYDLFAGETLAIMGESGSGKSVSAQALMGLVPMPPGRIEKGSISFVGQELVGLEENDWTNLRGEEIAMIFQDPLTSLNPVFPVGWQIGETFRLHRTIGRREAMRKAAELMDRVGIPNAGKRARQFPHQFSGGMRQRLMIAMALALEPKILIADEPTTALDVTVQAQIMDLLADLQRDTGMALILITHDLGVVASVADRVLVMYAGRAVETGRAGDFYARPGHPYAQGLMGSVPRLLSDTDRLLPIPGHPPSVVQLPTGCSFHPRCALADDHCRTSRPDLTVYGDGSRQVACFKAETPAALRNQP